MELVNLELTHGPQHTTDVFPVLKTPVFWYMDPWVLSKILRDAHRGKKGMLVGAANYTGYKYSTDALLVERPEVKDYLPKLNPATRSDHYIIFSLSGLTGFEHYLDWLKKRYNVQSYVTTLRLAEGRGLKRASPERDEFSRGLSVYELDNEESSTDEPDPKKPRLDASEAKTPAPLPPSPLLVQIPQEKVAARAPPPLLVQIPQEKVAAPVAKTPTSPLPPQEKAVAAPLSALIVQIPKEKPPLTPPVLVQIPKEKPPVTPAPPLLVPVPKEKPPVAPLPPPQEKPPVTPARPLLVPVPHEKPPGAPQEKTPAGARIKTLLEELEQLPMSEFNNLNPTQRVLLQSVFVYRQVDK